VALCLGAAVATPALASAPQLHVEVFGDSMETQAYPYFWFDFQQMTSPPKLTEHAWPGTAICDWLSVMANDAVTIHPVAVTLTFVGNHTTSCMATSAKAGTKAIAQQYHDDLTTAINTFLKAGTKYVFVYASPTAPPGLENYASVIRDAERQAVSQINLANVKWINAGDAVNDPTTGGYTLTRNCVSYEITHHLCSGPVINGQRTNYVRVKNDLHFCIWPWPKGYFCAGSWRYANSEVTAIMDTFKWSPLPPTGYKGN
jgi:uncharacterized protein YejL (UPF0352 family)